ncbi:TrmO family methyltransferase domain-containing protein [Flexivirga oryzae]|uniref:tRNA-Thr(GGU) m(6)t(6)A37 methyltransferase TsaA n=1 Tax=Flexivirga oryzae TaxID=1794944 RepID=A0A839N7Q7_9MICO|nr:tRNA-Thr(GGU) m(6)t(6)A37 methyltransferase TsaA [Flexivirga oryzae]
MDITVAPIAHVRLGRTDPEDDFWGGAQCRIELAEEYDAESLSGLEDFSHLEIVYLFDRVDPGSVETTARHPRNRSDWPLVGIFGQRGKRRPNRLGVSRCALISVEHRALVVEGLDAIDGTPILDMKPWMREFGPRGEVRQPEWATELMADYYRPESSR